MSKRKFSAEERIRIAELCILGKLGQTEAAREVGVDESVVRDWIRLYSTEGATAFVPKEGSIIFLVGLTWPRYHSPKPYASLDMNLRQCAGEAPRRRRTQEQL